MYLDCILKATDETYGQEATFCESICNSWFHRQCAGLSKALFIRYVCKTEGPFYNLHCRLITHNSLLQELKTTVDNITKEVTSLKATIAIIGKSNPELHSPRQLKQQGTQQYPQQATQHIEKQDIQTYTCHCACFC